MYQAFLSLEKSFFSLEYILNEEWLDAVLHRNFQECGKSGFLYNKEETKKALLSCDADRNIIIYNFSVEAICSTCWMVHYITKENDELYYRTSLWVKEKQTQLRFHQATPLCANVDLAEC